MQKSVEGVEVNLGPGHRAKRRGQFVPLPFSFGSNDDDFVPERFAGPEIVLPIFRHKKFEHWMRPEA